jgi:hypothetical protein
MAIISRSVEENPIPTSNNSRVLFINEKSQYLYIYNYFFLIVSLIIISIKIDSTTITNEHTENENWPKMTTVSLTSNNLQTLTTTQNVHISSSVMRTKQQYERIPINTQSQSMKPYPSLNTIVNDQSTISTTTTTIQTTISNQQTTFLPNIHDATTEIIMMTTIDKLITTMGSEVDNQTSSNDPMISTVDSTSTLSKNLFFFIKLLNSILILVQDETTSIPEETSFTTYFTRHFNIQSSTINNADKQKQSKVVKKFPKHLIEDDVIDDFLF